MKNHEIARLFDRMADLLEVKGENRFRIRAYRRAALNIESLTEDIEVLAREQRLEDIPGIGSDLAGKIMEYLTTGRMLDLEATQRGIPPGVVELMSVPGIGPKTAKLLYEREGVVDLRRLEDLARAGKLRGVPGIQAKTEENILKGLVVVKEGQARMLLGTALPLAEELRGALQTLPETRQAVVAGSLRRMKETVGDVDLLVTSLHPERVIQAFVTLPQATAVLEKGKTKASIRHRDGIQVDLRVIEPDSFGAALAYFTGSKQHNIRIREMAAKKGLKLSEYGLFKKDTGRRIAGATEEEIYAAVGLPWIPPELREDAGEIEAALAGELPPLVELDDLRGDLHCHTKASDGHQTIEALVEAAVRRGYEYLAITDHSPSTRVGGGLTADELAAHVKKVRAVQRKHPEITILAGSECDILPDGSLDYPDEVLARLDLVVAAVHSGFKASKEQMTKRICAALAHPAVSILAHPTGRLIGERSPYEVDLDRVFAVARQHGKAIEINAFPQRLDLNDIHARRCRDLGALTAINSDAHMLDHLDSLRLGVAVARRGWLSKADVANTRPVAQLRQWLRAPRLDPGPKGPRDQPAQPMVSCP